MVPELSGRGHGFLVKVDFLQLDQSGPLKNISFETFVGEEKQLL